MKEKANSTTSEPVHVRLAMEADRARLIPLVNSAFSIETFLEGTRTDEERLAATMRKGHILWPKTRAASRLAASTPRCAESAATWACWRSIPRARARAWPA